MSNPLDGRIATKGRWSLDEAQSRVSDWNAARRAKGWKHFYYIKQFPEGHWEVRETREARP